MNYAHPMATFNSERYVAAVTFDTKHLGAYKTEICGIYHATG